MPNPTKHLHRLFWLIAALLLGVGLSYQALTGIVFARDMINNQNSNPIPSKLVANIPVPKEPDHSLGDLLTPKKHVSIGFVGDIIPGLAASSELFTDATLFTSHPDVMIGNFEGVATSNDYAKCRPDSIKCFAFNGNAEFLSLLHQASFDVLNIANNHFNDFGAIGQQETLSEIAESGMIASGIKNEITYITKNNLSIGIIGVSNYEWTFNMDSKKTLAQAINTAHENSDIVVVIFHGGGEGVKYSHTPFGTEWYLDENRGDLREFSHAAIDAGADVVLGSGPHVLRGIENYNGKLIAYSLGNFASANPTLITTGPMKTSAMIELVFEEDGEIASGILYPFELDKNGIPHPDANYTAIPVINKLSEEDFGGNGIKLTPTGEIILK